MVCSRPSSNIRTPLQKSVGLGAGSVGHLVDYISCHGVSSLTSFPRLVRKGLFPFTTTPRMFSLHWRRHVYIPQGTRAGVRGSVGFRTKHELFAPGSLYVDDIVQTSFLDRQYQRQLSTYEPASSLAR